MKLKTAAKINLYLELTMKYAVSWIARKQPISITTTSRFNPTNFFGGGGLYACR